MSERNVVVIGTSAGGVDALKYLARGLPASTPAAFLVVCHVPAESKSELPQVLSRSGKLLATHAEDGAEISPGHIYLAPPDHHLIVGPNERMYLTHEPRENMHRPAIDPLFRSAANYYGPRVVGVVLSGSLNDGSAGLMAIRAAGGIAVVQEPSDAIIPAMPQNAMDLAGADYIVPASKLAPLIVSLVGKSSAKAPEVIMDPIQAISKVVAEDMTEQTQNQRRGEVSVFSCPECGGTLWQVDENLPRFRCHVGHIYNAEALLTGQSEALEAALWTAVRGFREQAVLARQLEKRAHSDGNGPTAERFHERALQSEHYAALIVEHVLHANARPGIPTAEGSTDVLPKG